MPAKKKSSAKKTSSRSKVKAAPKRSSTSGRSTSRSKPRSSKMSQKSKRMTHQAFFPIVILALIIWFVYRALFQFPVWFDETIGKAVFFGMPVYLYISVTGYRAITDSFANHKMWPGLFRGLAIGGLFGFAVLGLSVLQRGTGGLEFVPVFTGGNFTTELVLALLTGFWETLFFYSFVMAVILDYFEDWSLFKQVILVTLIFLLFHVPNAFLRYEPAQVLNVLFILAIFALGQALVFWRDRNSYTLILTQALWGLALLTYF